MRVPVALRFWAFLIALLPLGAALGDPLSDALKSGDETAVFRVAKQLAEADDPVGQYQLGIAYRDAQGVARDSAEAAKWLRRAADQGLARAQNALGALYAHEVNLLMIESRPAQRAGFEYLFFVDCIGHREDANMAKAIEALKGSALEPVILGSYPSAE